MLEASGSDVWELNPSYIVYGLDIGEGVFRLFSLETGAMYKLNRSSYQVLSLVDGRRTLDDIADQIALVFFGITKKTILEDAEELLAKLREKSIAQRKEGGGVPRDDTGA